MVRFVNAYEALVQLIQQSDWYENTKPEEREVLDKWLQSDNVRAYYGRRVVPQLTLHESLILAIGNSNALQARRAGEQETVMAYVTSPRFKRVVDHLENSLLQLSI